MMTNIEKLLKPGHLVNRKTLYAYGLTRPDVDYYLRSGFLSSVARGIYVRNDGYPLSWKEIAASLKTLGFNVHVGGASAIREAGLDHFVSVAQRNVQINIFSHQALPDWINKQPSQSSCKTSKQPWLEAVPDSAYRVNSFGPWNREIKVATLELALLEQLIEAKLEPDIVAIDRQLEGMPNLSPTRLNDLLMLCPNIKAKRLLGWLSNRHEHAWVKRLKWDTLDLGKGKRSVIKGGRYNDQWQITVPREMENQTIHGH